MLTGTPRQPRRCRSDGALRRGCVLRRVLRSSSSERCRAQHELDAQRALRRCGAPGGLGSGRHVGVAAQQRRHPLRRAAGTPRVQCTQEWPHVRRRRRARLLARSALEDECVAQAAFAGAAMKRGVSAHARTQRCGRNGRMRRVTERRARDTAARRDGAATWAQGAHPACSSSRHKAKGSAGGMACALPAAPSPFTASPPPTARLPALMRAPASRPTQQLPRARHVRPHQRCMEAERKRRRMRPVAEQRSAATGPEAPLRRCVALRQCSTRATSACRVHCRTTNDMQVVAASLASLSPTASCSRPACSCRCAR